MDTVEKSVKQGSPEITRRAFIKELGAIALLVASSPATGLLASQRMDGFAASLKVSVSKGNVGEKNSDGTENSRRIELSGDTKKAQVVFEGEQFGDKPFYFREYRYDLTIEAKGVMETPSGGLALEIEVTAVNNYGAYTSTYSLAQGQALIVLDPDRKGSYGVTIELVSLAQEQ